MQENYREYLTPVYSAMVICIHNWYIISITKTISQLAKMFYGEVLSGLISLVKQLLRTT